MGDYDQSRSSETGHYPIDPSTHIIAETHATDSYQNLLFSLLRFRLHTGHYPRRITVVTHEFKRRRFLECHFPAIGFSANISPHSPTDHFGDAAAGDVHLGEKNKVQEKQRPRIQLVGIDPPAEITSPESLLAGEEKTGIGLWRRDWYGTRLEELAEKRKRRGWMPGMERTLFTPSVGPGLEPVVERLLIWNGGRGAEESDDFPEMEMLPWSI
jgi:hypothetical protein